MIAAATAAAVVARFFESFIFLFGASSSSS
jgi:hypothetical protein